MDDITSKELHERTSNGEKLNIIDVREEWEFEEKNIGAVLIPLTGWMPHPQKKLGPIEQNLPILALDINEFCAIYV